MKMNLIKFAELIGYISRVMVSSNSLHLNQIEEIASIINNGIEQPMTAGKRIEPRKRPASS